MGIDRIFLQCATPRPVPGVLTQKENPTAGRSSGSRSPHTPRERRYIRPAEPPAARLALQTVFQWQARVCPVSDAMATKTAEIRRGICGRCAGYPSQDFALVEEIHPAGLVPRRHFFRRPAASAWRQHLVANDVRPSGGMVLASREARVWPSVLTMAYP
jgi:hypothetical protein